VCCCSQAFLDRLNEHTAIEERAHLERVARRSQSWHRGKALWERASNALLIAQSAVSVDSHTTVALGVVRRMDDANRLQL
jgi:hypothetical protein